MATDRATADEVAISHYEWIKRGLDEAGIDPNPYNIAMAWNCGLSAVVAGHVPTESYRYADQVKNLVQMFEQRAKAEALAAAPVAPTPTPAQSEFHLQFNPDDLQPHFFLEADADAPLLVVTTEVPRYVISPKPPLFSLALAIAD